MVTSTMSPRSTSDTPSYMGLDPDPMKNAPPWIHTITGRAASSAAGVNTFRWRHSSPMASGSSPRKASIMSGFCGAIAPNPVASRTPSHGSTGTGSRHRPAPPVDPAKGIPANRSPAPWAAPRT